MTLSHLFLRYSWWRRFTDRHRNRAEDFIFLSFWKSSAYDGARHTRNTLYNMTATSDLFYRDESPVGGSFLDRSFAVRSDSRQPRSALSFPTAYYSCRIFGQKQGARLSPYRVLFIGLFEQFATVSAYYMNFFR